jgi:hypothetical protein
MSCFKNLEKSDIDELQRLQQVVGNLRRELGLDSGTSQEKKTRRREKGEEKLSCDCLAGWLAGRTGLAAELEDCTAGKSPGRGGRFRHSNHSSRKLVLLCISLLP